MPGAAGYGLFTTALGFGVAIGAVGVSALQRRLDKARVFTWALFLAGAFLFAAATSSTLGLAALFVGLMGITIGPVYVMGYVLLQEEVDDDLRGRVFSSLNTLVRLCVLVAMVAGPLLAALLGGISEELFGGTLSVGAVTIAIPGVRLTLWLAALIIMGAGILALHSVRSGLRSKAAVEGNHPSRGRSELVTVARGRFVAFEGGEGCGKSTQAGRLADALAAVATREPGGTDIGARLRDILLDPGTVELADRAEALLMAADRAQHLAQVVGPALASGRHVVSDRSAYSSIAYQGYGRGLPVDEIRGLSEWAADGVWPDLVILLEVPAATATQRLGEGLDRMERLDEAFHRRVADGFRALAEAEPARWVVVDGSRSIDEVAGAVRAAVAERLQLTA